MMETKTYASGPATCRVRQCLALPGHMRERTREVLSIYTPKASRGQGHATTLMHKICADADEHNIVLVLFVEPFEHEEGFHPTEEARKDLEKWYCGRFGFVRAQDAPMVMLARMPGATPRMLSLTEVNRVIQQAVKNHAR